MPYKSTAQFRFMHARHPGLARRWDRDYGVPQNLPQHVTSQDRREALKRRANKKRKHAHG